MTNLKQFGLEGIWQPAGETPTQGYLMVVLHGRGDSAEGFSWLKSALNLTDLSLLLVNAPDEYYTGYSWYDLPPNQLPGILRSREILENVFAKIFEAGFVPEKCFLFGFSQGCLMTLEFGARYPKRLAGYVGVSGYCFAPKALLDEASPAAMTGDWLITHGTLDEVLPIEKTRTQMKELVAAGFPIEYFEYPKGHTIDDQVEFPMIRKWISDRM